MQGKTLSFIGITGELFNEFAGQQRSEGLVVNTGAGRLELSVPHPERR